MRLDLDLPAQLVLDARLAQLVLEEHLERNDEVRLLLARQVDLAKLPVPQRLADIKVSERPLAPRLLGFGLARRSVGSGHVPPRTRTSQPAFGQVKGLTRSVYVCGPGAGRRY